MNMIPTEPPILSLRRLVEATGCRATLEAEQGRLTAELRDDVLKVRARGVHPPDATVERLSCFMSLLVGPSVGCSDDIDVEVTVCGISNLVVYDA